MTERTYGHREDKKPEDPERCIAKVWDGNNDIECSVHGPHQCTRKRGFGKDNLYCKQHAKYNERCKTR